MQTSRFQLGLIATLAVGLGFSLASSEAVGYPAGAVVSLGTNPVWSAGGESPQYEETLISTVPDGRILVVTDISFTMVNNESGKVQLRNPAGEIKAEYRISGHWTSDGGILQRVRQSFNAGVPFEAGESVVLYATGGDISYTVSGYYAQP